MLNGLIDYFSHWPLIFLVLLIGYYVLPAVVAWYYLTFIKMGHSDPMHIQGRKTGRKQIRFEVLHSLQTVLISSVLTVVLFYCVELGYTRVYFNVDDYGWMYFFLSPIPCILIHDAYFYWAHRFMHLKKVFPLVHRTHHLSHTPNPFSILSFSAVEAVLLYLIFPIVFFFVPLHPVMIVFFVVLNVVFNTMGHLGLEITPLWMFRHRIFRYFLTVTHHDLHHSKVNCNYGQYFVFWDKLMGTLYSKYEETYLAVMNRSGRKPSGSTG